MAIENFFTVPIITQKAADGSQAKGFTLGAPMTGSDFLNIFMAKLSGPIVDGEAKITTTIEIPGTQKTLPKLDLAKLLAANPEIEEQIKSCPIEVQAQIAQTLALNQKAFDDVLKPLTSGTITTEEIENGAPGLLHALLNAIQSQQKLILEQKGTVSNGVALDDSELAKMAPFCMEPVESTIELKPDQVADVIAKFKKFFQLHLTPKQMTEIQHNLEVIAKKTGKLTLQDVIAEISVYVKTDLTTVRLPPGLFAPVKPDPMQADETGIIPLVPPGTGGIKPIPTITKPPIRVTADPTNSPAGFNPATSMDEQIAADTAWQNGPVDQQQKGKFNLLNIIKSKTGIHAPIDLGSAIPPQIMGSASLFANPADMANSFAESFGMATNGFNFSSPANFASLLTQAPGASSPHPATQMVSATIFKGASNGENKSILLELDPPELGRVEVRMNFGKDKTVKATLTIEKPETYAMLQRDAHLLERALQDAGLDANGALSFQLADSGQFADRDNQRGGGHDKGGTGTGDAEAIETIETTMNWHVDPDSGHVRYNILA